MKILYGVQGTGNGHITRARAMAPLLKGAGVEVDYLFSGRPAGQYFAMEPFGNYQTRTGLTLRMRAGGVSSWATATQNSPLEFLHDYRQLNTQGYDHLITDFEPVTAWAGRRAGLPVIGLGHQYAFQYPVPIAGTNLAGKLVFRHFAPAQQAVGLHWHHFDQPILPPVIEPVRNSASPTADQQILVYMPSTPTPELITLLATQPDYQFRLYTGIQQPDQQSNCTLLPFSREGFQHDLRHSGGVICNAGFALVSELLALGKKSLVIPLGKHMEQLSNAAALNQLGLATTAPRLTASDLKRWLDSAKTTQIDFPNTAEEIVKRLIDQQPLTDMEWIRSIWDQVTIRQVEF